MTNAVETDSKTNFRENLPSASDTAATEALRQADEYESVFGTTDLELDNGDIIKIPPHPDYGMLDDDCMAAYEELMFKLDTEYDREEDIYIPEQVLKDGEGNETGVRLPATTQRGTLKTPYRIKNKLVKPPHGIQVVIAALGQETYDRLKAGGRSSKDVWKIWGETAAQIRARQQRDTFRPSSSMDLAPVPATNSQ
jgi:hypothetical protein